jgi:hypothetical protein
MKSSMKNSKDKDGNEESQAVKDSKHAAGIIELKAASQYHKDHAVSKVVEEKAPTEKKEQIDLIAAEDKDIGGVGYKDYKNLLSFGGGCCAVFLYFFMTCICTALQLAVSYIIVMWVRLPLEE